MKYLKSFVDPLKIGNFWFTSSSERWEQGKSITLIYDEYNATVDIKVMEIMRMRKLCLNGGLLRMNILLQFR